MSAEGAVCVCVVKLELEPRLKRKFVCEQYSKKTIGITVAGLIIVAAWLYVDCWTMLIGSLSDVWGFRWVSIKIMILTGELGVGERYCCRIYSWNWMKTTG
jgi:hypothetical protein